MIRLVWVASERVDPEDSFPALAGKRPAPEPVSYAEAPAHLARSLADVVLVDGRGRGDEAATLVRKLRSESDVSFLVVLSESDLANFDWHCGAGDFVVEGCPASELNARIEHLVNPLESEPAEMIRRGEVTIDRSRFEVRARGEVLDLTFKEFELLVYLASRPGRVCSRRDLLTEVWAYDFFGGTRTVDVHIRRLRAKLGPSAHLIETVRNVGYRFSG